MVHPNALALDSPDFLPYVLAHMILQQHQLPHVYNHHLAQQLQLQHYQQQQQQLIHQLQLQNLQHQQLQHLQLQQAHQSALPAQLHQPSAQQQHLNLVNQLNVSQKGTNSTGLTNSNINSVKNLNTQCKSSIFESIAALTSSNIGNNQQRTSSPPLTPSSVQSQPTSHSNILSNTKDAHQIERLLSQSPQAKTTTLGEGSTSNSKKQSFLDSLQRTNNKFLSSTSTSSATVDNHQDHQSAAINSLSNFVSGALAPILDDDKSTNYNHQNKLQLGKLNTATSSHNLDLISSPHNNNKSISPSSSNKLHFNNSNAIRNIINQHRKSSSIADSDEEGIRTTTTNSINNGESGAKSEGQQNRNNITTSALDLISSAAQSLKNSPVVAAAGTTINTTLAKAPPELVKKQPAWVFCTRYSDRPSSGPRTRRAKSKQDKKAKDSKVSTDEKRPRTAFTSEQLDILKQEFKENSYLDEKRRKDLADRLCLNENQIKIWFQNKRAKIKKQNNQPNPLRGLLVAGGLYNHSTATSDCSESYANGNDQDQDADGVDCMDSNDLDI